MLFKVTKTQQYQSSPMFALKRKLLLYFKISNLLEKLIETIVVCNRTGIGLGEMMIPSLENPTVFMISICNLSIEEISPVKKTKLKVL